MPKNGISPKTAAIVIAGVVLMLSALIGQAVFQTHSQEVRAKKLLAVVSDLHIGEVSEADSAKLLIKFLPQFNRERRVNESTTYQSFVFDNLSEAKLRISHYRQFAVTLQFDNDKLSGKTADFIVEDDCRVQVKLCTMSLPDGETTSMDQLRFSTSPKPQDGPASVITITDDPRYPAQLTKRDWSFDLGKLSEFGGCNDARSLLPTLLMQK